jgi:hypothetical protein
MNEVVCKIEIKPAVFGIDEHECSSLIAYKNHDLICEECGSLFRMNFKDNTLDSINKGDKENEQIQNHAT